MTGAFGTYISVIVSCFPNRAIELIDYMGIIREAAADFPGLCFLIYDYQFCMKAAADKSIYWGVIDSQLWLRIFSKHPSRLWEAYQDILDVSSSESNSLFYQDPSLTGLCTKGTYKGATAIIEEEVVSEIGVVRSALGTPVQREPQPVTGVEPHIMDHIVLQTTPSQNQTQREEYKVYSNLRNDQSLTSSNEFYKYADDLYDKHNSHVYPTPVNVDQLERALNPLQIDYLFKNFALNCVKVQKLGIWALVLLRNLGIYPVPIEILILYTQT